MKTITYKDPETREAITKPITEAPIDQVLGQASRMPQWGMDALRSLLENWPKPAAKRKPKSKTP